ncbi:MAG: BlaI/MecI/CopY family transcriptional regulator [Phycisphaerae bacterium]|nr:BlaI/MecI/CopY family transcriptional regulator [Phycisphaerae bacterium]
MAARPLELGDAELEILKVLWDEGPGTVRDVLMHLQKRKRRPAYTTVQTLLTRLENKRFVTSNKTGLAFVYRPRVSREQVTRARLNTLVNQLFNGEAGPLVLQLVKSEKLTPKEIGELHRLIDELDQGQA